MKTFLLVMVLLVVPAWAEPAPQLPVQGMEDSEIYVKFNASETHLTLDSWGEFRVWDLSTLRLVKHIKRENTLGHDVSPDGRWMAIGSYPRRLEVLDLREGKVALDFTGVVGKESGGSYDVAFSPDGKYLFAYGGSRGREQVDKNLRVWRTSDWQRVAIAAADQRGWGWWRVIWTPWGQLAVIGEDGRKLQLYDPVGLKGAGAISLSEESTSMLVEGEELVVVSSGGTDDNETRQRLRQAESTPRLETRLRSLPVGDTNVLRLTGGLWLSAIGYGGPATVYAGEEKPLPIGSLEWACPPEVSPSGKLVAMSTKRGVLILDVQQTVTQEKLVPYHP